VDRLVLKPMSVVEGRIESNGRVAASSQRVQDNVFHLCSFTRSRLLARMPIASINPATGEKLKEFSVFDNAEIEKRLSRTDGAFRRYRGTTFTERSELLHAVTELLFQEKQKLAEIITLEMGKLFRDSVAEIEKCAGGCRFYAENGARFLEQEATQTDAAESYVEYQPLGPVLAIMPWNFPFWQVFRFAAPALMAGNVGLLKHASNVPQCALAIENILCRAGFEEGVFQTLMIEPEQVEKLIVDPRVKAVTVTGSEKAGAAVASVAAREIKKSVLELGGSDAFIVMPSADFERTLSTAVKARTINTGQSCIAAKRFIVADQIYQHFLERFVDRMRTLKLGDPMDPETELGPLATEQILQGVHDQVQKSIAAGAKLLTGGNRVHGPGFFYEPTVLVDVPKDSPAYREEVFGPVAAVFRAGDAHEAIDVANDSTFGLGASAWTNDRKEQKLFVSELDAGMVFINAMVASDPRLPFGGVKRSGFGRELGAAGIREFTNTKTIWIS
jgi:succinate-semialdehyde dehydrogenase/glutarate-semialdehyde dehydrogenase